MIKETLTKVFKRLNEEFPPGNFEGCGTRSHALNLNADSGHMMFGVWLADGMWTFGWDDDEDLYDVDAFVAYIKECLSKPLDVKLQLDNGDSK